MKPVAVGKSQFVGKQHVLVGDGDDIVVERACRDGLSRLFDQKRTVR